jgi:hypothetical protein
MTKGASCNLIRSDFQDTDYYNSKVLAGVGFPSVFIC